MLYRQKPIAECNSDLAAILAELAIGEGDGATLAEYISRFDNPSPHVVQGLIHSLVDVGPGNQRLRFKSRNGRLPNVSPWPAQIDEATALDALERNWGIAPDGRSGANERALSAFLSAGKWSSHFRQKLAEALSKSGGTRLRLEFKRARPGNSPTPLRSEIRKAFLGHWALDCKETGRHAQDILADLHLRRRGQPGAVSHGKTWEAVRAEMGLAGCYEDDTGLKEAVRSVRQARQARAATAASVKESRSLRKRLERERLQAEATLRALGFETSTIDPPPGETKTA